MYKIVIFITVLIFTSCNYTEEIVYVNANNDIIFQKDSYLVFYSKHCISAYKFRENNNLYSINRMAFYCRNNGNSYDLDIDIINHSSKKMVLSTNDYCFVKYLGNNTSSFYNITNNDFTFDWDTLEILYSDGTNFDNPYKVKRYQRKSLSKLQVVKLLILTRKNFKMDSDCSDCTYFSFKFIKEGKIVFEKMFTNLPCWYIEMK